MASRDSKDAQCCQILNRIVDPELRKSQLDREPAWANKRTALISVRRESHERWPVGTLRMCGVGL